MAKPTYVVMVGEASSELETVIREESSAILPGCATIRLPSVRDFMASAPSAEDNSVSLLCIESSCIENEAALQELVSRINQDSRAFLISLVYNVGIEKCAVFLNNGVDVVIDSAASESQFLYQLRSALTIAKTRRRLLGEIKEASDIALLAMETSSFLGEVIKFLETSFASKTLEELFYTIQNCISRMNLNCCAVMDSDGNPSYFCKDEERIQLETMLAQRGHNRIWDLKDVSLFSYPWLSLMVYPMPVNESDRYGQLKDVLAMLVNGASARVHGINVEHKALQAYETKSAFLAKMSHELRTPLNAIIGFSRLLQRKKILEAFTQRELDAVSAINTNGHHLLSMVTDLLDFAQLDVGGLTLAKSHCDVVPIISKVVEGYRFWADEKKIDLYPVTAENGLIAVIDPARLEQACRNIISNAIKYTDSGFVKVQVQRTVDARLGDCFTVSVSDSGVGISEENYRQLVQIFTRPNLSAVRSLEGVGMGLSMAAALVELHQGHINLERLPEGGSLFVVTVPLNPISRDTVASLIDQGDIELF